MSDYNSGAIISGGLNGAGDRAGESFATEIWGPVVETKMKEKLVLSPLFNDLSSFVATQGERMRRDSFVKIPKKASKSRGAL